MATVIGLAGTFLLQSFTGLLGTLVAAALFNPLRHRVQLRVDRRFNRTRYNADQMVAAFAAGPCLGMDQARYVSPLEGALGSRGV